MPIEIKGHAAAVRDTGEGGWTVAVKKGGSSSVEVLANAPTREAGVGSGRDGHAPPRLSYAPPEARSASAASARRGCSGRWRSSGGRYPSQRPAPEGPRPRPASRGHPPSPRADSARWPGCSSSPPRPGARRRGAGGAWPALPDTRGRLRPPSLPVDVQRGLSSERATSGCTSPSVRRRIASAFRFSASAHVARERTVQAAPGQAPVALHRALRGLHGLGRLLDRETGEEAQPHEGRLEDSAAE